MLKKPCSETTPGKPQAKHTHNRSQRNLLNSFSTQLTGTKACSSSWCIIRYIVLAWHGDKVHIAQLHMHRRAKPFFVLGVVERIYRV